MNEHAPIQSRSKAEKERLPDLEGAGEEIPTVTRHRLETTIGDSLSGVRLHRGPEADRVASPFGATGLSYGNDIVLSSRAYSAGARGAEAVLAHEAAHAVQQRHGGSASLSHTERSANLAAVAHVAGERAPSQPGAARGLRLSDCDPQEAPAYADPSDYQFDESNLSFLETRQDIYRRRTEYHDAIRGASAYSMPGAAQRRRFDDALSAEGISQAEYDRRRMEFLQDFQGYAVSWAFKMLSDSYDVVTSEQSRYAAGTDVDALWDALGPARAAAPQQAAEESLAAMAMGTGPPAVSTSTLAIFGFESTPRPAGAVERARARVDTSRFPIAADPELDAQALDGLTRANFPALLDRICRNRLTSLETAATHLHEDNARVWGLNFVLDAALRGMEAPPTSPLHGIVSERRPGGRGGSGADTAGIFAMLFGLLSGVGGIVGAAAILGAVVSGAYAAVLRYDDFAFADAADETDFDRASALASQTDADLTWVAFEVAMIVPDIVVGGALVRALRQPTRALTAAIRGSGTAADISRASEEVREAALRTAQAQGPGLTTQAAEDVAGSVVANAQRAAADRVLVEGSQTASDALRARGLGDPEIAGFMRLRAANQAILRPLSDTGLRLVSALSATSPGFRAGIQTLIEAAGASTSRQIIEYVAALRPASQRRYAAMIRSIGESGMSVAELRAAMSGSTAADTTRAGLQRLNRNIGAQRDAALARRAGEAPGPNDIDSPLRGTPGYEDAVKRRGTLARELEGPRAGWTGADEARFRGMPTPATGDAWHINSRSGRLEYRRNGSALHTTTEAMSPPHRLPPPEPGYRYQRAPDRTPPYRVQADPVPSGSRRRRQRELYELPGGGWGFRNTGGRLLDSGRLGRSLEAAGITRPARHQAHHLSPSEVVRDHKLFQVARELPPAHRYDGDRASNGIFLPDSAASRADYAPSQNLPIHNTSHPRFTDLAREAAQREWDKLARRHASGITDAAAQRAAIAAHPAEVAAAVRRVEDKMRGVVLNWVSDNGPLLR